MATNNCLNIATAATGKMAQGAGLGVDPTFSTSTYPSTNAANTLLYASSADVMAALATANNAMLATNASGVPSLSATPTVTSITFGSGAALNTFTQGTFTPSLIGSTTNPTPVYTNQLGRYQRVGRIVKVFFRITYTSISGGSGNLQFAGLPFTTANINNQRLPFSLSISNQQNTPFPAAQTMALAYTFNNTTTAQLFGIVTTGGRTPWLVNTSSTFDMNLNGLFEV